MPTNHSNHLQNLFAHKRLRYLVSCLFFYTLSYGQEVREYIDLQTHPTMHIPYSFFGQGLGYFETLDEPKLSYKHLFKNVNFANYLKNNSGVRVIVTGALTKEGIKKPAKARAMILAQIEYINSFAQENSDDFVVARSPQEAREYITTTKKTVIIHSIEGAKKLVNSQEDANFWAQQGVSFITVIHLVDSELGSAAIKPSLSTKIINWKGWLKRKKRRGGLTQKGKQVILWLANAGIMTDITHMSDQSRDEALDFMEEHEIPPIATHDLFRPIQNHPRGISEEQIIRIYKNEGFISLPISGVSLQPYKPYPEYQRLLDGMTCHCNGSIDSYQFTYEAVKKVIESNHQNIRETIDSTTSFDDLNESEKVNFSIGFQSDFNGWLNHSRPRYGNKGCWKAKEDSNYEAIEIDGMPHPGYLTSQWRFLEKEGVDLEPIKRNSEKFLQLWEYFITTKKSQTIKVSSSP